MIFYGANRSNGTNKAYKNYRIHRKKYIEAIRVIEEMGGKCFAFGKTLSWLGNGSELPLLSHYDNVKKWGGVVVCWKKGVSLQSASGA